MPRPLVNLDPYRTAITQKWRDGKTIDDLLQDLKSEHGLDPSRATLYRRLKTWNLLRQVRTENADHLQDRIRQLFFEYGLSDNEIHRQLKSEGFTVSKSGVKRARLGFQLFRRHTPAQIDELQQQAREFFEGQQHIDNIVRSYGKEYLYTYLRQRQINLSRSAAFDVYKEFYQGEVDRRRQRLEYRRMGWTTRGPNFLWSIDGYCKLQNWGFEVYAGIDEYSRFITWFYVGVKANTSLSVLAQYICLHCRKIRLHSSNPSCRPGQGDSPSVWSPLLVIKCFTN